MRLSPYLVFNGQCEAAFKFYQQCLGGKISAMIPHEGTPAAEHVPANWLKKIMHAQLVTEGQILMGSDRAPDQYKRPEGFSVAIAIANPADADRIFHALSQGANVTMPIQETFWALRFGMLVDQFGIPWMINCEKPA